MEERDEKDEDENEEGEEEGATLPRRYTTPTRRNSRAAAGKVAWKSWARKLLSLATSTSE